MSNSYTPEELEKLQTALYQILSEIKRVCKKHGIRYFITGGTAIGAYFWEKILPWDDDVDVGMLRPDYEHFMSVAQEEFGDEYFVQTPETDSHVPFFFMKVRMNGTEFNEETFSHIKMHQGIYVDIFPFDKVPKSKRKEQIQYNILNFLNGLFIAKEIWQWRFCGHCDIAKPRERGFIPCLMTRILITLLPKSIIFWMMKRTQTFFNNSETEIYKNIITKSERIASYDVTHAQLVKLGNLEVAAPKDLLTYLNNHYGKVRKDIPDEMKVSHRPLKLKFKE
ncbi:MAG: LicD family protein [Bacteroidaceae bacterium]|nr:LicD family protein [Bacteroidaceae bacterium]